MKTVLITGANKGIGFETAKVLIREGYYVYLGCRNKEYGILAEKKLKEEGFNDCSFIQLDVTDQASINKVKIEIERNNTKLDVLINNAGILGRIPTPDSPLNVDDVQKVFETNFFGVIRVTQTLLPLLNKSESPRIVNVTSDLASLTLHQDQTWKFFPLKRISYGPSKTALNAYTVALAYELMSKNFKINCVTPGETATDINNYKGDRRPKDACKVIAKFAMLDDNGPTGKFFSEEGELPW